MDSSARNTRCRTRYARSSGCRSSVREDERVVEQTPHQAMTDAAVPRVLVARPGLVEEARCDRRARQPSMWKDRVERRGAARDTAHSRCRAHVASLGEVAVLVALHLREEPEIRSCRIRRDQVAPVLVDTEVEGDAGCGERRIVPNKPRFVRSWRSVVCRSQRSRTARARHRRRSASGSHAVPRRSRAGRVASSRQTGVFAEPASLPLSIGLQVRYSAGAIREATRHARVARVSSASGPEAVIVGRIRSARIARWRSLRRDDASTNESSPFTRPPDRWRAPRRCCRW